MKKMPIGVSDYKELIEGGYYYVDKTLLIKEFINVDGKIILVPRPRRFGKTLNLSMLQYFFERTDQDHSSLFVHTKIWQEKKYRAQQGTYPVIFLTFKGIKELSWKSAYQKFVDIIVSEFDRHQYLLQGNMSAQSKAKYQKILEGKASQAIIEGSLSFLSEMLYKFHHKNVLILLDEYDVPILASYSERYYKKMISFMRSLLEGAFKDNKFLARGVITGILRIAKEGVFTGLNNLAVCTLLNTEFQDKFGFTESEIKLLLAHQGLSDKADAIQRWYNGYLFGATTIYNPWSILQCVSQKGQLKPYWLNTSDNYLVKKLIALADDAVKSDLELLLDGKPITKEIDEAVILPDIEHNYKAIWNLLVFTGYVTYEHQELVGGKTMCDLVIPNEEIKLLYTNLIQDIMHTSLSGTKITTLLKSLTEGDVKTFGSVLQEFIANSMSAFDFSKNEPDKSYHLFVLGLLVALSETHEIKSNRESGNGRYDIMIIPRDSRKLGIIIEFKTVSKDDKETLKSAAQNALDQIKSKNYVQELYDRGIKKIQLLGVAFHGKNIFLKAE